METRERFNLRWDDFEANIKVALRDVRDESEFFDVTLVGGDGKQVKANKVILAGGSTFFFNILRENPHPHPLIYLKAVTHHQLLSLLDFLYTGEASIAEEDLNKFLDIAEDLKVKGLTPIGSQTKSNRSTSTPLQSQGAVEEASPSRRVYHHSKTSTIPASLQNQMAVKEAVASPGIAHPHHDTSAFLQSQFTVEESATRPKISRPPNVTSSLEDEVAIEELVPSPKSSRPPSMIPLNRDNMHVGTNNVKVEVGDAEHYNVAYGLNDRGKQFITHVSLRGCKGNISNVDVLDDSRSNFEKTQGIGDLSEECQSEGMWLSETEEKNNHIFPVGKKPKQETIDSSTDVIISEAVDNEHLDYGWYERGEENNGMIQSYPEENDYFELDKIDNSLTNFDGNQEKVDSNHSDCDMNATKAVANDQSIHACDERGEDIYDDMIQDGEQDINRKKCSISAKTFSMLNKLEKHKICHIGESQFQCLQCSKKFSRQSVLKRHEKIHTGEKPYQCDICFKRFLRSCYLKSHQTIHIKEKPFQCSICFKRFSRMQALKDHEGTHTGENPYPCLQCSKKFPRPSHLKQHMKVHTGEKPYQCQICFKRFPRMRTLKDHEGTHTGENPYPCLQCSKKFTRPIHLKQHKKVHTSEKLHQ